MRISDWSSDVCSSDLPERQAFETRRTVVVAGQCEVGDLSVDVHAGHLVLCIDKTRHRKQAGRQAGNPFGLHTCILRFVQSFGVGQNLGRSEEHTSELQSLMRISYAVFCLKKKKKKIKQATSQTSTQN